MLSIQISDIKDFMSHLLSKDTFDHFYFIEASIKMGVSYQIQGRINEGFYDTSVEQTLNREFCYWKEIRHRIFDIIKGKRLPLSCKIVLGLSKQSISYLIAHNNSSFREEDIEGIYVNILYDPKNLLITTGISYKNFSLDKSLEYAFGLRQLNEGKIYCKLGHAGCRNNFSNTLYQENPILIFSKSLLPSSTVYLPSHLSGLFSTAYRSFSLPHPA